MNLALQLFFPYSEIHTERSGPEHKWRPKESQGHKLIMQSSKTFIKFLEWCSKRVVLVSYLEKMTYQGTLNRDFFENH